MWLLDRQSLERTKQNKRMVAIEEKNVYSKK